MKARISMLGLCFVLFCLSAFSVQADENVTVIVRFKRSSARTVAERINLLRPKSSDTAAQGPRSLRGMLASRRRFFYDEHQKIMQDLFDSRLTPASSKDPLRRLIAPIGAVFSSSSRLDGVKDFKALWLVDAVRVRCSSAVAAQLRKHEDVSAVEIDPFLEVGSSEAGEGGQDIRPWHGEITGMDRLAQEGLDGEGISVGIIDSGISPAVPFAAHVEAYRDFTSHPQVEPVDPLGHGTAVASLIAADEGIGGAPASRLVVARAVEMLRLSGDYSERSKTMGAFASRMIEALQWMIDPDGDENTDDGPQILNCSWGFPRNVSLEEDIFRDAVKRICKAGILPVFSAGNARSASANRVNFPGIYEEVLTVGATTREGERASFSCVGSEENPYVKPDIMAPGDSVVCIGKDGSKILQRGTSFSAPIVSASLALLLQARPDLEPSSLRRLLSETAEDRGLPGKDREYGHGNMRLYEALELLEMETDSFITGGTARNICRWIEAGGLRSGEADHGYCQRRNERFETLLIERCQSMSATGDMANLTRFLDQALPGKEEGIALRRRLRQRAAFLAVDDPAVGSDFVQALGASFRP